MEESKENRYTKIPHRKRYAIFSPAETLLNQPVNTDIALLFNFSFMEKFVDNTGVPAPAAKNLYHQLENY